MTELTSLDDNWLLLCAFLVLIMQAGFCLFEAGLVRSKNSINVAFKNLSDFTAAALTYWLIGFGLMYGESLAGIIGTEGFLFDHDDGNGSVFIYQLMFCGAATTIVGGALAERTRFSAYLILSIVIAGLVYPMVGHWVWATDSLGNPVGWLGKLGFIDFAGGTVVHGVGGWVALAAVITIGARLGRFPAKNNNKSSRSPINASSFPLATVGVLLLWFGWFGFNTGSAIGTNISFSKVVINTAMSAAAGGMALVFWFIARTGKPEILGALNGTLAGLVGVTAGAHLFSTYDAVLVGVLAAFAALGADHQLQKFKIDDVISAFPVHAVAGAVGTLLIAILGDSSLFPLGYGVLEQFGVQLLGVVAVAVWSLAIGIATIRGINYFIPARVSALDEMRGLNVAEHGATTETVELLGSMALQRKQGDFSKPVPVEPHTEVGQIASEYNQVIDRVRLEIQTREEAYKQLKQASHFQYIFENTQEGILQLGLDGKPQAANPAAARILGYASVPRLLGDLGCFMQNLHTTDTEAPAKLHEQLEAKGQISDLTIEYKRIVDDKIGYANLNIRSIPGRDEQEPCFLASLSDLTDKRENEKLIIERNSAEEANKAKSQFLANMSHEIRTPLNGVTGMLELLSRSELEEHQQHYIHIAQNSAQSLLSVINDILDFSKIEAGKMELDAVDFKMSDTLADVVDIFASQTARKNIELIGNIDPSMPNWVIGDPERLRQVLINLLGNAVKFTEEGHIALTATCDHQNETLVKYKITIEDSGCGISEENQRKLFHSFTQADSSTTRKYGGTGLGLTISRQLVALMKGDITVESEPNKGSRFTITMVLPKSEKQSANTRQLPASLKGTTVLVVDDHPVNQEYMRDLLIPFGLKVQCAESGEKALKLVEEAEQANSPFELCLLDYHMPNMDGIELAAKLRARDLQAEMKLIMLTSIDQVSISDPGMSHFDARLVKPVRASRLFDSIVTALESKIVAVNDVANPPSTLNTNVLPINTNALGSDTKNVTILLAEDNPVNQLVASKILSQANYNVDVVEDGQKVLDRLAKGGIDLVLMDCQMPVMDGFEATRNIRENEREKGISKDQQLPIIALTANALKGDRELCIDAGMNEYITKPLQIDTLFSVLSHFVPTPIDAANLGQVKKTGT